MQNIIRLLIVLAITAGSAMAASLDGYHTFTDLKGRNICARIIQCNTNTHRVFLERKDGKQAWIDHSFLSKADLAYIKDWCRSYRLLSADAFRVTVEPETGAGISKSVEGCRLCKEPHQHELTLMNTTMEPIEGVRIDYRYFIKGVNPGGSQPLYRQEAGAIVVGCITNGQAITVDTTAIHLISKYALQEQATIFGTTREEVLIHGDELLGVWFKVQGSCAGGVPVIRDICIPSNLQEKVQWQDTRQKAAEQNTLAKISTR